ncbi:Glycosyl hydrolase family 47 [Rhizoctonia solani]|uniref:alpha-1,2-Mannosidase n=1 Tax=Rhizoctonia solani TaxID=456999 RepID=A0A8H7M9I3_9AGAM|nr:Glycosyl hydrolase family 47 [Rhizoctonia solani]
MWPHTLFIVITLYIEISYWTSKSRFGATAQPSPRKDSWTKERKLEYRWAGHALVNERPVVLIVTKREATRQLWHHGFDSYMDHAFPMDELMPKACRGRGPDYANPANIGHNDVMANFSLTLVDNLDTFVTFNNYSGFEWAVRQTIDGVSFDQKCQASGLLSAHIFAADKEERWGFGIPWYNDELLHLAYDLGKRLLPAFRTNTGIPFARINLRHGVPTTETFETCSSVRFVSPVLWVLIVAIGTAGAGSLLLEWTTLSRLTGDPEFERVARKGILCYLESPIRLGLLPNTINLASGVSGFDQAPMVWSQLLFAGMASTGNCWIGAGIDSFYEYALKMYVMTGESEYYDVWREGYSAIMKYSRVRKVFGNVGASTGNLATVYIDSLSAFWPGLQVLAGDVQNAIKSHLVYWNLWRRFSGIPETFNIATRQGVTLGYPLRPEFIESTYFLYRVGSNPITPVIKYSHTLCPGDSGSFYLDVGERVLHDLIRRAKVNCGLSTLSNVQSGEHEDRMESFALSETLKYLFLIFDEENKINSDDQNMVFTTEGHLITLSQQHLKTPSEASRYFRQKEQNFCPSIRSRPDSDYGRFITGLELSVVGASDSPWWDLSGRCAVPQPEEYVSTSVYHDQASPFDFDLFDLDLDDVAARLSDLLGAPMEQTPLTPKSFDYVLSIDGMVTEADKDLSTSKVHRVEGGFMVRNITGVKARMTARMDGQGYDVTMLGHHRVLSGQKVFINDPALLELPGFSKLQEKERKLAVQLKLRVGDSDEEISLFATTALFGADPSSENSPGTFRVDAPPLHVVPSNPENLNGCSDHEALPILNGAVLVVNRGTCSFLEKLTKAKKVGAAGVIVVSDVDSLINPSLDKEEEDYAASELADVGLVVLTHRDGVKLLKSLETSLDTVVPLWVKVTRQPSLEDEITKEEEEKPRLLYINGKALINTVIMI